MYKQLKSQIDDKNIIDINIRELEERIRFILRNQLGLKATSFTEAKIESGGKKDKFAKAFIKVEKLDKDLNNLKQEKEIIEKFLKDVEQAISKMNDLEKDTFRCRYMLGLTRKETARRLDYSEDRIKQVCIEINKKMKDYPFITR